MSLFDIILSNYGAFDEFIFKKEHSKQLIDVVNKLK